MSDSAALRKTDAEDPVNIAPEIAQRAASDPAHSVWVGASAGSGKTTVLTNRVMRLLLDGVKPQKILCLTFTRAAAAEMSIRVMQRLSLWTTCSDNELSAMLGDLQGYAPTPQQLTLARRLFAQVLACPGGMRIRTIHAFCQEILGRFPIEAGLPPHFAVIDEADAQTLMDNVQRDLLRDLQTKHNPLLSNALRHLVYDLGEHGFTPAMKSVLGERARLNDAIVHMGSLNKLIERMRRFLTLEAGETEATLMRDATDFAFLPQNELRAVATQMLQGKKTVAGYGQGILHWLSLQPEERIAQFEDYWRCFLTKEISVVKLPDKDLLAKYPDIEPFMAREAARLQSVLERLETISVAETTEAVLRLGRELSDRAAQRKAAQAALDYDDLIIHTNNLLHRPGIAPWVLFKLDGGLDHILVDEAQDTSRAQWRIIKTLADEFFAGTSTRDNTRRTLFIVGDAKQSIFSFQNADPDAFAEMRNYFAQRLGESGDSLRSVGLHISFRSAPAILKAVDSVFATPEAKTGVAASVEHSASRPRAGENEKIGRVELWPLIPAPKKEAPSDGDWVLPGGYEDEVDPQTDLAVMIASTIEGWLKNGERLTGTNAPIEPGDIMILLRNRGRFADLMVRALKQRNVPVTGVDRMKLTEQLSVMDLLALIQFTLLPEDDLNLATVLRGPLLGCSEEQLMALAIGRDDSLWQSLSTKAQTDPLFAAISVYLMRGLHDADFITPFQFLSRLLNEPCPGNSISGRRALWSRLGPDALDPIEEFLNAAQNFSLRHAPSLQMFLHQMMASKTIIKREMDHGDGQVRIMTVHGSKGLEAPIVFLPDTSSVPRVQNVPKFLWSKDNIPLYLPRKPQVGIAHQLWTEARRKQMEEYRRLLYVALTRAASRLYICGWEAARQESKTEKTWYQLAEEALTPLHEPENVLPRNIPEPLACFADPVTQEPKEPQSATDLTTIYSELPAWARQPTIAEAGLLEIFAPSRMETPPTATPDSAFTRGRIIHRLLQSLPEVEAAKRAEAAKRFLANPRHNLSAEQQQEIRSEVLGLFERPDYAPLFQPGSRAEVPLTGKSAGHVIAGQVDRLCVTGNEVWIVDYKTSRPPPLDPANAPLAYRQQLAAYRAALRDIYPGKTVRCFLLWTYGPRLMELPEELLEFDLSH